MTRALIVVGTRPEVIKMAPVHAALAARPDHFTPRLLATAQHRSMLDQALDAFRLQPDLDLDLMRPGQELSGLAAALLQRLPAVLAAEAPDVVLVQGDTTTSFVTALAAFHARIPVAHVEAGLRTFDLARPFPEEANRRLTSVLADLHFAPTPGARANLLREGTPAERIFVTGNTVIDALLAVSARLEAEPELRSGIAEAFPFLRTGAPLVLVTGHRRESFGPGFEGIGLGLSALAHAHPEIDIVYPVHLNPQVREPVERLLGRIANLHLVEPVGYLSLIWLLTRCRIVITDSGGIQEEAPSLGRPVLVMRETTERPEGLEAGTARLVGTDPDRIVTEARRLLEDETAWEAMARSVNPYGDGHAAGRIAGTLEQRYGGGS
jgi:UDP-N-acetylglucosamine 2-epimerase (non-hydrolysing)